MPLICSGTTIQVTLVLNYTQLHVLRYVFMNWIICIQLCYGYEVPVLRQVNFAAVLLEAALEVMA